jgi:transposase
MQLHWVDASSGEIGRRKLSRAKFVEFFSVLKPARVVMEACGGAHHWARSLGALGHQVELLPARQVRSFVRGNKDDAADARAIWVASQHGDIRRVAIKSAQQQAVLSLHRLRAHWVSVRTASVNALRGLLYEFGIIAPKGWRALLAQAAPILADEVQCPVPALLRGELLRQLEGLRTLTGRIAELERQIGTWQRREAECQRIAAIPGVGPLSATAIVATVGDARTFRSGREFAAFLGLVPRQSGTGGRVKLLGISKRGDPYLRTLLIHGARTVLNWQGRAGRPPDPWLNALLARRPKNVVIVALANKMARTIWALMAHGRVFDRGWGQSAMTASAMN